MSGIVIRTVLAAVLLLPFVVEASGLRISPVRVDMSVEQTSSQLNLTNAGTDAVPVQITAYRWWQENGEDHYERSRDIFFAPPIVTVPKDGSMSVRLRLRKTPKDDVEATYRLHVQELPPPNEKPSQAGGMNFRVRFSLPVFIQPKTLAMPQLDSEASFNNSRVNLVLENTGKAHIKIEGIEVFSADVDRNRPEGEPVARARRGSSVSSYMLAGTRQDWVVAVPPSADPASLVLLIRTSDRTNREGSGLDRRGWRWLPVAARRQAPTNPD